MPVKRIGIYSGTFDPIHDGHMAFALESIKQGLVDHVVFLPEPKPRGKNNVTEIEVRLAGVVERIKSELSLSVELLPIDSFTTASTLPMIRDRYPDAEISLLIGSDVAKNLASWPDIEQLKSTVNFIIGLRDDNDSSKLRSILTAMNYRFAIITTDQPFASSSQLRSRI